MVNRPGTMAVRCGLLVVTCCALAVTAEALKCACNGDNCLASTGPDEVCTDHVPVSFIERKPGEYNEQLVEAIAGSILAPMWPRIATADEKNNAEREARGIVGRMSSAQKLSMLEYLAEIQSESAKLASNVTSDAVKRKMELVATGKASPAPVNNQFCVKVQLMNGVNRGCGAAMTLSTGQIFEEGCGTTEMQEYDVNYCRCATDLCNEADGVSAWRMAYLLGCVLVVQLLLA